MKGFLIQTLFELKKDLRTVFFAAAVCVITAAVFFIGAGDLRGFGFHRQYLSREKEVNELLSALPEAELQAYFAALSKRYGPEITDAVVFPEEMLNPPGLLDPHFADADVLLEYRSRVQARETLENARLRAEKTAAMFLEKAEREKDRAGILKNRFLKRVYEKETEEISCRVSGWDEFLEKKLFYGLLPMFLLLPILSGLSFSGERESGTLRLLYAAKDGRRKMTAAKMTASALTAAGLTLWFSGVTITAYALNHGLMGGKESIRLLPGMELCPYMLRIRQYFVLTVLAAMISAATLSVLLTAVSAFIGKRILSCAVCTGLTGLMLLPMVLDIRQELLRGPLTLLKTGRYFDSYYTADIFSLPVPWSLIQAFLALLLCGITVALVLRRCSGKRNLRRRV